MSSSGGNAGLAAAYCARELGIPISVVVPESTPEFIVKKLSEEGATVEVIGKVMVVNTRYFSDMKQKCYISMTLFCLYYITLYN